LRKDEHSVLVPSLDAQGRLSQRRQDRPALPDACRWMAGRAVQQVVGEPDGIECGPLHLLRHIADLDIRWLREDQVFTGLGQAPSSER
jgi:hypothetical protein